MSEERDDTKRDDIRDDIIDPYLAEKEIVTQRLVLIDGQGRPRALLGTAETGDPCLFLMDEAGRTRFSLFLSGDGSGLHIVDASGSARIRFKANVQDIVFMTRADRDLQAL